MYNFKHNQPAPDSLALALTCNRTKRRDMGIVLDMTQNVTCAPVTDEAAI